MKGSGHSQSVLTRPVEHDAMKRNSVGKSANLRHTKGFSPRSSHGRRVRHRVVKRKCVSKLGIKRGTKRSAFLNNVVFGSLPGVSWVRLPAGTSPSRLMKSTPLRSRAPMKVCASPLVAIRKPTGGSWEPLVDATNWPYTPEWLRLPRKRGKDEDLPRLSQDALFWGNNEACLLPFLPPVGRPRGHGAVVIIPGGNYQFLQPQEARPVARWFADHLGVPAFVLKYRLLPACGLSESTADLREAILQARRYAGRSGPVVAIGFSAGGHLVASSNALGTRASRGRAVPDAQVLVYPAIYSHDWMDADKCGFGDEVNLDTPQVRSLAKSQERILPGSDFVAPPPTFLVGSTSDGDCPPKKHSDHYAKGVLEADVPLVYMRDDFGDHGFALQDWWARPCLNWLQERGFGRRPQ